MNWMDDAACKGMDTDIFYPVAGEVAAARAICRACPVQNDCFQWSLDIEDEHAVLGGVAAFTRQRILTARRRKRKAS